DIIVLKLHGSVSWFDENRHLADKERYAALGMPGKPDHLVFDKKHYFDARRVTGDSNHTGDLERVWSVNLDRYFEYRSWVRFAPLIVAPSYAKLAYLPALRELWADLVRQVGYNKSMTVIGFQMPDHD